MMLSPLNIYNELSLKSTEEIISAIRGFKNTIGRLKNKMERERFFPSELIICPSDDVVLSCTREYMNAAFQLLEERGVSYPFSKADLRARETNEMLDDISEITFEIGSWCSPRRLKCIKVNDYFEITECSMLGPISEPFAIEAEPFIAELKKLHIGEWRTYYSSSRHGMEILDGEQWELEILFSNGKKKIWSGSNDYPYNFEALLSLFGMDDFEEEED